MQILIPFIAFYPKIYIFADIIEGDRSLLMIDMHHIISDGTSHAILEREFQALYSGEELPALKFQYKDYSHWQNSDSQQAIKRSQEEYWLKRFEGELPVLNLPTDFSRPVMQSHEGVTVRFTLSKEETAQLKSLVEENSLTLYMSVLSVYTILLSKLSGQEDIIVGTPIAGRNHIDLENIVGMFVNTLAIRNEVRGSDSIKDYLRKLKQNTLASFENQDYQFEDLVDKVSVARDISRNPVFDVMFNLQNQSDFAGDLSGFNDTEYVHRPGVSKFYMTLTATDYREQILLSFQYCTRLFTPETIERFIAYFKQVVRELPVKIDDHISTVEIITESEKQQVLYDFNNTSVDYPREKTIHELFEEQVCKHPQNIAVVSQNREISYEDLNILSNKIAHYLREKGINSESIIGIELDPSIEFIVSMLGVLKAGGAYLPIDTHLLDLRKKYIIENSQLEYLIHNNSLYHTSSFESPQIQFNDIDIDKYSGDNLNLKIAPSSLAYIIYT